MKHFRNVSSEKQIGLQNQFSAIDDLFDDFDKYGYQRASISVYDHWLTREEAEEELDKVSNIKQQAHNIRPVSYTHLRAHETSLHLVCRLLLEKKK